MTRFEKQCDLKGRKVVIKASQSQLSLIGIHCNYGGGFTVMGKAELNGDPWFRHYPKTEWVRICNNTETFVIPKFMLRVVE